MGTYKDQITQMISMACMHTKLADDTDFITVGNNSVYAGTQTLLAVEPDPHKWEWIRLDKESQGFTYRALAVHKGVEFSSYFTEVRKNELLHD